MYFLDGNVIIIIMQSNGDGNQINSNFQVFFRTECNFGNLVIQSSLDSNFQVFLRPQCHYHYCSYGI